MQAEVISIGDELTSGQRLDTNSQWLSQQLGELGIRTLRHTTVGDDLAGNIDALRLAATRADVVVCTGGLGPTLDDLTRQAMAEAFDCPLQLHEPSLQHIQAMLARRNRPMPERNRHQAMFPVGSQVVPNPHGSAPGIDLSVSIGAKASRIFALPGVPAEMKEMWRETVAPRIEATLGERLERLRHHAIKVFGIGESDVEEKLPELIARSRLPTVGITVSCATITLRIAGRAHSDEGFAKLIAPTVKEIGDALGDLVFGEGEDELENVVLRQLKCQQRSLATLEVGASSWVSDWLLKAADKDFSPYAGGIALPSVDAALRWLSSERLHGNSLDASTNDEVWSALARLAKQRFRADIGLAIGCYPTAGEMVSATAPFNVFFAIAFADSPPLTHQRSMGGHPAVLGPRIAKTGLDLLRHQLSGTASEQL